MNGKENDRILLPKLSLTGVFEEKPSFCNNSYVLVVDRSIGSSKEVTYKLTRDLTGTLTYERVLPRNK